MNQKKNRIALAALCVFALAFYLIYTLAIPDNSSSSSGDTKKVQVEIIHSDGSSKTLEFSSAEETVGDLLVKEGLIEGEAGEFGLFITKADGEEAIYERDHAWWSFYIDNELAPYGVDQTELEEGRVYTLKVEHE